MMQDQRHGALILSRTMRPRLEEVSGFLCLGRLFQGQPNEAAFCFL